MDLVELRKALRGEVDAAPYVAALKTESGREDLLRSAQLEADLFDHFQVSAASRDMGLQGEVVPRVRDLGPLAQPNSHRRSAWRWSGLVAACVLLGVVLLRLPELLQPASLSPVVAQVLHVEGQVEIQRNGITLKAKSGASLKAGDRFKGDEGSLIQLGMKDGSFLQLSSAPQGSFPPNTEARGLSLLQGHAHAQVAKSPRPFSLRAPLFDVEVLGTRFDIHASQEGMVMLHEGQVRLVAADGSTTELSPGEGFGPAGPFLHQERELVGSLTHISHRTITLQTLEGPTSILLPWERSGDLWGTPAHLDSALWKKALGTTLRVRVEGGEHPILIDILP